MGEIIKQENGMVSTGDGESWWELETTPPVRVRCHGPNVSRVYVLIDKQTGTIVGYEVELGSATPNIRPEVSAMIEQSLVVHGAVWTELAKH